MQNHGVSQEHCAHERMCVEPRQRNPRTYAGVWLCGWVLVLSIVMFEKCSCAYGRFKDRGKFIACGCPKIHVRVASSFGLVVQNHFVARLWDHPIVSV